MVGPVVQAVKHSCTIYYYLCVLTNMTNTCTYRFDLSQSDLNNGSEHLVQKTYTKPFPDIFLRREFDKEQTHQSFCSELTLLSHRPWKAFRSENVYLQKTKRNLGKSVLEVILLQLRDYFIFEVPYVVPWLEYSSWNSKACTRVPM